MTEKKFNKKALIGVVAMIAVIAVMATVFVTFRAKPVAGSKEIVIEVVDNNQETTTYELKTDAEYLEQAMEEADGLTYSGTEGPYGLMIDTVNGLTANFNTDGAYWSFYVNDEYCMYGMSEQPVLDGDTFTIKYETSMVE